MKNLHESVFMSALRAFFTALFAVLGIAVACTVIGLTYAGIASAVKEESFSSNVKILPDADGNRKKLSASTPILLQISIDGEIGKDKLTGKNIEEILLDSRDAAFEKGRIKGILLTINSPGGGVTDSDMIYCQLKQYKERYGVPIFAYVDGLCASGGYYIACAADKIYSSNVSLVGSIGVLSWPPFMNLVDALEKIGVSALTLSAGEGKDEMNPFRAWQPDEQKQYQTLINFYYNHFVEIVSTDRSIEREKVVQTLGAKVFPAPEALNLGLVDKIGYTRNRALTELAQIAGIEGKYQVIGFESSSWWKKLMKEEATSPLLTGKIKHELPLPLHKGNPFSYIWGS